MTPPIKNTEEDVKPKTSVSRLISFLLLVGIVAVLGVIFFKVMSRFMVPLFLSALLVVMFRPLHGWMMKKVNGRESLAALLTTLAILLLVLIPVSSVVFLAATEGVSVIKQVNAPKIVDDLGDARKKLGLEMPSAREIRDIEQRLDSLQSNMVLGPEELERHGTMLFEIMGDSFSIAKESELPWPVVIDEEEEPVLPKNDMRLLWNSFGNSMAVAKQLHEEIQRIGREQVSDNPEESANQNEKRHQVIHDYSKAVSQASSHFLSFKYAKLGGRTWSTVVEFANPTGPELQTYSESVVSFVQDKMFALGGSITSFVGNTLFGALIMVVGLYFFLLDGPGMLKSLQGLSPIEDEHEQELVAEFGRVSRAVVVATLLSAVAQGVLAGIGFYFCGLESVFLLTLLSAVLAMVPFVGAASVWIPCALYLYFVDNNLPAAIGLAIYGTAVISMADNFIKPWILHGQSNLHPLLALLSVIGGVTVLGPIGILVGPMIVVFLQTLLKIIQRELQLMEIPEVVGTEPLVTTPVSDQPKLAGSSADGNS